MRSGFETFIAIGVCLCAFGGVFSFAETTAQQPCTQTANLTVIPPGPVSDKIEIEIRLAIRNTTESERDYRVDFYWDDRQPESWIAQKSITVAAQRTGLVTTWSSTAEHAGQRMILCWIESGETETSCAEWPLEIMASETRSPSFLAGVWIEPGALVGSTYPNKRPTTVQDVTDAVDAMDAVGMKTIIISYVEAVLFGYRPFYPTAIPELGNPPLDFDVVGLVLDRAAQNGQHVFLGLGRGNDLYLIGNGLNDEARLTTALELGGRVAEELWELYSHSPAFYGWYLSHEANALEAASAYYNPMADFLHDLSPDKPVMISPSGTPILSRQVLQNSHVDIFAYQDAVGAGYVPYVYTYDPERRIATLPEVFASYRSVHRESQKHLWANLELWEMTGPNYGYPYPAADERVLRQIQIEKEYADVLTGNEFFGMMEHPESTAELGGPRAVQLYEGYREHAGSVWSPPPTSVEFWQRHASR